MTDNENPIDPEIIRKLNAGVALTAEEAEKLARATSMSARATGEFTDALQAGAGGVAKSLGKFVLDLGHGSKGFTQLNPLIDSVSNALGGMAKAIPFAGEALNAGIKAAAEGSKFLLEQLQQTATTFNDLGQVGALTAKGMTDLQKQFLNSGMSLDGFKRAVTDNAAALARFKGNVGKGAEDFTKVVGGIVDSNLGDELRRIGYSADQIGDTTASWVAMQTQLGLTQNKSNKQLAEGAAEYAKELDLLTKLTGQSRKQAQAQIDAALSESRFRSTVEKLNRTGQTKAAKDLMFFQNQVSAVNDELGQAIRDVSSGIIDSDAVRKAVASGIDVQTVVEGVKNQSMTVDEAMKQLQKSSQAVADQQIEYSQYIKEGESPFLNLAKQLRFNTAEIENGRLIAKKIQDDQIENTDELTNQTVSAQKSMEQMSRQIQNFGFQLMPQAAKAVESFTGSLNKFVKWVSEKTGVQIENIKTGGVKSLGPTKSQTPGQQVAKPVYNSQGQIVGYDVQQATGAVPPGSPRTAAEAASMGFGKKGPTLAAARGLDASNPLARQNQLNNIPGYAGLSETNKKIIMAESGGLNIGNREGTSSAFGLGQFTKGTFEGLASKAQPGNPLYGKTWENYKSDTSLQIEALTQLTSKNQGMLAQKGLSTSDSATYLAHFLGPGGASKALSMPDSAPLSSAVSPDQIASNRVLAGMSTVGDLKNWASGKMGGAGYLTGGVAAGPKSGYQAELHGTEAIVPLSDGKNIPVEMNNTNTTNEAQMGILGQQLQKLDEMISVMRQQNILTNKMLQQARA